MQLKFFCIPLLGDARLEDSLNVFLRSHKILECKKELIQQEGLAYWSFCIRYLIGEKSSLKNKGDILDTLKDEEKKRYEILSTLRKQVATDLGIPAFAVFTNQELVSITKLPILDASTLRSVKGVGEGKMKTIGVLFLEKYEAIEKVI